MSDPTTPFAERFLAFYDSCNAEERELLDYMGSAAVTMGRDEGADPEVQGFEKTSPQPKPIRLDLLGAMLSNVSKTRSEISMTFARNARA